MGLLLGASVLTLCELFDLVIFNFIKKFTARDKVADPELGHGSNGKDSEKDRDESEKPLDRNGENPLFHKNDYTKDFGFSKDKTNGFM